MDKTYTIIPDFMLDYDLNMTEIVALAVIYGFCQDGKSDFHGSYNYLARKCKIERRSAMRIVGRLEQKGYVDMPEATIVKVVIAKAAGALLLLASARIMEKYIPEETV